MPKMNALMPIRRKVFVIDSVATGRAYRTLRRGKDLSLAEVSHRMGIHFTFLGQLERGERTWSEDLCQRFQKALKQK